MYCFTRGFSYENTIHELCDLTVPKDEREELSSDTIAYWFHYCREMIVDHFSDMQIGKNKLGGFKEDGTPVIVQIDEAKFGKRKYNKGRRVDGHWVLGMVDTVTNDCRMMVVENREAATLTSIIKEHVAIGSEIHTDCFKSYDRLFAEGYIYKKVNHSVEFISKIKADDGTHTQKIESNWRPAKDWMRGRGRFNDENFAYRLCEYLWRRCCRVQNIDLMSSLMEAIKKQYKFN